MCVCIYMYIFTNIIFNIIYLRFLNHEERLYIDILTLFRILSLYGAKHAMGGKYTICTKDVVSLPYPPLS